MSSSRFSNSCGNAFVYVLIAVILLAALSFAISRSQDNNPQGEINAAAARAGASNIIAYELQAKSAIDNMTMNGTNIDEIDFILPSDANFNTAPTIKKLFHPDGGGLQYKRLPPSETIVTGGTPVQGFYIGRFNNTVWTPTTAQDVMFTVYMISKATCQELNKKVSGSPNIPVLIGGASTRLVFVDKALYANPNNADLSTTVCPECENKMSYCVKNGAFEQYAYYSIIIPR